MAEYLIRDYTKSPPTPADPKAELLVVNEKELLKILDEVHTGTTRRVAVYPLGDCVLDWS